MKEYLVSQPTQEPRKRRISDIDREISARILIFRKMLSMNRQDVARELGISLQQLGKYENAQNRIPIARLLQLSELYKIPIGSFFDTSKYNAQLQQNFELNIYSDEGAKLLAHFYKIDNPDLRKSVLNLLQTLAEQNGNQ